MEFEFDNEIDALLRQAAKGENLFAAGNNSGEHIDADEISMFAENALPEAAKPRVINHIADCGRCRTILSNVISLNAEDEKATVSIGETKAENVVETNEPNWFQKLFATKNLAFGMGALALIFAVGIGFLVLQYVGNSGQTEVAKSEMQNDSASAVSPPDEADSVNETAADGFTNANKSVSNSGINSVDDELKSSTNSTAKEEPGKENNEPADKKAAENSSAKTDNPESKNKASEEDSMTADVMTRSSDDSVKSDSTSVSEESRSRLQDKASAPATRKSKPPPSSAPAKKETKSKRDEGESEPPEDALQSANALLEKRRIGSKTFTRKSGVWYDSAYSGQSTANVRRGTSEYRNLDSGLRSITDKLDGTVILVWKQKAFRIQ